MVHAQALHEHARALGFNLVGLTRAEPSPRLEAYLRWIEAGQHGNMGYMARPDRVARRRDLNVILPGARSLIVVGLDYHALNLPESALANPSRGRFAAYAWGVDYHDLMTPRLEALADWLRNLHGPLSHRVYVDTGAILERSHAQSAGLGFVGKNTMLIHPRHGSYFFLGEILTNLDWDEYDAPGRETMCGNCRRCLTACPTDAFPQPYRLDARRCISYLTIEHKGWIPAALRPRMGNWVMGCDICQDVCPFQRFAVPTAESGLRPPALDRAAPPLLALLRLDSQTFAERFNGSAVERVGRDRLVRNACVAAGNWGDPASVPALIDLLTDASPLVRGHAVWALRQIGEPSGLAALADALRHEPDELVRAEMQA